MRKRHNDGPLQGRFVTWHGVKIRVSHIRAGCGCQLMGAERGLWKGEGGGGDLVLGYLYTPKSCKRSFAIRFYG